MTQTKRERVLAAIAGRQVDRTPVAAWGHLFPEEKDYGEFVKATIHDFKKYDWDFIKINNPATLYDEAWGNRYDPTDTASIFPKRVESVTNNGKEAFTAIGRIDAKKGVFGTYLKEVVRSIVERAEGAPVIQTVFSPLSVFGFIVSDDPEKRIEATRALIAQDPVETHRVLSDIAESLADFARESVAAGADGIFFAIVQLARSGAFTETEYREYGVPYDLTVLRAVKDSPFNLFHTCGSDLYFDLTKNYPAQAINYDAHGKGNPGLKQAQALTGKAVTGGIDHGTVLITGTAEDVRAAAKRAIKEAGKGKFILSPGCSIDFEKIPEANLKALRTAVE